MRGEEMHDITKLLRLRKLTRTIADLLRGQLKEYLATLAPLLRPQSILGGHVAGTKEVIPGAEKAFEEFLAHYQAVAGSKLFALPREPKLPLEAAGAVLEIGPIEYLHEVGTDRGSKAVTVTSPLRWALNYGGFAPQRLRELLADRQRSADEVQQFVVHYLEMHLVLTRQPGIAKMLEALHFPIQSEKFPEFGELPVVVIGCSVATHLPPDEVICESTEISGRDVFEEVVNVQDVLEIRDPLGERLRNVVRDNGADLLPAECEAVPV